MLRKTAHPAFLKLLDPSCFIDFFIYIFILYTAECCLFEKFSSRNDYVLFFRKIQQSSYKYKKDLKKYVFLLIILENYFVESFLWVSPCHEGISNQSYNYLYYLLNVETIIFDYVASKCLFQFYSKKRYVSLPIDV